MIRQLDSGRRRGQCLAGILAAGLGLAACGGGGDGGGGGGSSDRLSGVLSVLAADDTVLEAEPNDVLSQAHILGEIRAGQTKTIVGATSTTDQDIFQVVIPERAEIDVALTGQDVSSDIDVYLFDPVSLQQVAAFATTSSSEAGSFVARGTFLALVEAASGSSDYELVFTASAPGASLSEVEPNDGPSTGQYVGMFDNTDSLTFTGDGTNPSSDFLLLSVAEASTMNVSLSFDGAEDYDVFAFDVTAGFGSPTQIAALTSVAQPEVGQINVNAMTLVALEIRPISGATSAYTLQLDGSLARLSGGALSPGSTAGSLVSLSPVGRGSRLPVRHASFRGDVIVDLRADGNASGDPSQSGGALRGGWTTERLDDVVRPFGGQVVDAVPGGPAKVHFELPAQLTDDEAARYTFALAACLRAKPGVAIAEPDFVMTAFALPQSPDDPYYNLQWHYEQIQLPAAWGLSTGSSAVRVAVLDTGSTPAMDLAPRVVAGYDMISDASIAADGDGRDGDPTDEGDSTGIQPSSFHGSHVSGTIGAVTNNAKGVAGVTWQSQIMHVRCLGRGGGSTFDILNGVLYAAGLQNASGQTTARAHVQNMSLGGGGFSQTFQNAIDDATAAGSLIIAAAGNENSSTHS